MKEVKKMGFRRGLEDVRRFKKDEKGFKKKEDELFFNGNTYEYHLR